MKSLHLVLTITVAFSTILGTVWFVDIQRHADIFIPEVEPDKVFGVFSNFTNFFMLEPNLIRFKLLAEFDGEKMVNVSTEGRYNEFKVNFRDDLLDKKQSWGYIVWYEEYYQYLPSILTNKNEGQYTMSFSHVDVPSNTKQIKENDGNSKTSFIRHSEPAFSVTSHHRTEFLPGRPISTKAVNSFKSVIKEEMSGTLVTEYLYYESPLIFLPVAYAEVEYQRPKVLKALFNWKYD